MKIIKFQIFSRIITIDFSIRRIYQGDPRLWSIRECHKMAKQINKEVGPGYKKIPRIKALRAITSDHMEIDRTWGLREQKEWVEKVFNMDGTIRI